MTDLNRLLQRLGDADLDFVIVGGFAAVLHGSTLLTRDLDICAPLSAENVGELRRMLRELEPVHRLNPQKLSFLDHPAAGVPLENLYLDTKWGALDVLGSILGVGDFRRVRSAAVEVEIFGRRCCVISLEDLIAAKQALGREKDLLAAKELRAIAERRK